MTKITTWICDDCGEVWDSFFTEETKIRHCPCCNGMNLTGETKGM